MNKTILTEQFRLHGPGIALGAAVLLGLFALFSSPAEAANVTKLPAVVSSLPKVNERIVTRFSLTTFERMRHRQLSLGATFMPDSGSGYGSGYGPAYGEEIHEGDIIYEGDVTYRGQSCGCRNCRGNLGLAGLFCNTNGQLWFQNYGDFVTQQSRNGIPGYKADSYGFSFGYDFQSTPCSIWGVALGGSFSNARIRNTHQKMETDSFLVALYGARTNSVWNLMGTIGYIYSSFDAERQEMNLENLLRSEHHGNTLFGSFEISTALFQDGLSVSPFLAYDIIGMRRKEFSEKSVFGWEIEKRTHWSYLQTLGLRFERSYYAQGGWLVNPSLSLGWLHDYGSRHIRMSGSAWDGDVYTFRSTPMNKNRFAVSLNVSASLQNHTTMFLRYDGEYNKHYNAQTIQFGFGFGY